MRTVVGYAGGTTPDPTYHHLGDHTESIQVEFDPKVTSYAELLDVFFADHDPCAKSWSRQYQAILFWRDDAQRRAAEARSASLEDDLGRAILTELRPFERFFPAEDYHQKYYLRSDSDLYRALRARFASEQAFIASPIVAKVNAHLGGHLELDALREGLQGLGLRPIGDRRLEGLESIPTAASAPRAR